MGMISMQCLIPFVVRKSVNSELIKHGPLSVAIMSERPNWINRVFKCWMVILDVRTMFWPPLLNKQNYT